MGTVQVGHLSLRAVTGLKDKKHCLSFSVLEKIVGKISDEERSPKNRRDQKKQVS